MKCFLKAYNASDTKHCFRYDRFDNTEELYFPEFPPYEAFLSNFNNNSPLDKDSKTMRN